MGARLLQEVSPPCRGLLPPLRPRRPRTGTRICVLRVPEKDSERDFFRWRAPVAAPEVRAAIVDMLVRCGVPLQNRRALVGLLATAQAAVCLPHACSLHRVARTAPCRGSCDTLANRMTPLGTGRMARMLCSHNIWDVDVAIRHFEIPQEYSYYSCMPTDPKSKTECRSSAMELRHRPLPRQTCFSRPFASSLHYSAHTQHWLLAARPSMPPR